MFTLFYKKSNLTDKSVLLPSPREPFL